MPPDFRETVNNLDEDQFQLLYGRWDPLEPAAVDSLLAGRGIRWHIAGGRAARLGAAPRRHEDTDVVVRMADLEGLRDALTSWHLWEANDGALRPLLPGMAPSAGCEQLWARRDASQPWQLDLPLDRASDDTEWVFKRDASVRLPWAEALRTVAGIAYLRPEIALLHKARLDRPKDRADLAAARLDPADRAWLAQMLDRLGHSDWARRVREDAEPSQRRPGQPRRPARPAVSRN
jgi:hypothetical protein